MGYSASLIDGQEFTVTDPTAVMTAIATKERVSWCRNTIEYLIDAAVKTDTVDAGNALALTNLLTDYGFIADWSADSQVSVMGWCGDKLGGDWNFMWDALAQGTTDNVNWLFAGEDGEMFLMKIIDKVAREFSCRLTAEQADSMIANEKAGA